MATSKTKKPKLTPQNFEQTLLLVLLLLFVTSLAYIFIVKEGLNKETKLIEPTSFTQNQ